VAALTADLIIVLRDGSVAEQGSHEELMRIEGGVYRRLWEAQLTESTAAPVEARDVTQEKA
jgi:ABC transporter ATM